MGYVYAFAAVLCGAILGLTYKLCDHFACDRRQVNVSYFLSAAVVTTMWTAGATMPRGATTAGWLGAVTGLVVFICVVALREAVARGPISITYTILNLSVAVPTVASILIWREIPSLRQGIGLALTAAAIVLLGIDVGRARK